MKGRKPGLTEEVSDRLKIEYMLRSYAYETFKKLIFPYVPERWLKDFLFDEANIRVKDEV